MRLTESPRTLAATVAIVDPRQADYAALLEEAAETRQARLMFLSTGSEALRLARTESVDLWIVNVDLPDMSGLDLCTILHGHASRSPIYMVTDHYRSSDERAARINGASVFTFKPIQLAWLDPWCPLPQWQHAQSEKAPSRNRVESSTCNRE